jgi:multidrug efflux pump subunit AcrA (membrane-fusion protein)
MFVQVKLTIAKAVPIVVVPKEAIYTIAGLTKLFVIRNNKAVELRIAPGQVFDGSIEVPGGVLKPSERVAIDNLNNLYDGAEVRSAS